MSEPSDRYFSQTCWRLKRPKMRFILCIIATSEQDRFRNVRVFLTDRLPYLGCQPVLVRVVWNAGLPKQGQHNTVFRL